MNGKRILGAIAVFGLGLAAGVVAAKKGPLGAELFQGKSTKDAGHAVLAAAGSIADKSGSWERIAYARVRYLSGDKAGGQAVFDQVLSDKKVKAGDDFRVAK